MCMSVCVHVCMHVRVCVHMCVCSRLCADAHVCPAVESVSVKLKLVLAVTVVGTDSGRVGPSSGHREDAADCRLLYLPSADY